MSTYVYYAGIGDGKEKSQSEMANALYEHRAANYEDSWHPEYTQRMMDLIGVHNSDRILLLACGTGLEAAYAAPKVGEKGSIVGLDVCEAMLNVAQRKLDADIALKQRVHLIQHNITDLENCPALGKHSFDLIICSNAFVLLEDKEATIKQWTSYLKPDGRLVIDIPHEHSVPAGTVLENICKSLGVEYPLDRSWLRSEDSFRTILESQGLKVTNVALVEKRPGKDVQSLSKADLKMQFHKILQISRKGSFINNNIEEKAWSLFDDEWDKMAVGSKVEVCESLRVYIAVLDGA